MAESDESAHRTSLRAIRLWRRAAPLEPEQFRWRWLTGHAAHQRLAGDYAPISRITAAFVGPRQIGTLAEGHQAAIDIDFDAVESYHFELMEDLRACLASGVLASLEEQAREFAEPHPTVPWIVTLDELMGESTRAGRVISGVGDRKMFRTLSRAKTMDLTQLRHYWHGPHRLFEMASPYKGGWAMRTHVSFSLGQRIVGNALQAVDDTDIGDTYDAVLDSYYPVGHGADPWVTYETVRFPPEVRADEMHFVNFDAHLRRAVLEEYEIFDSRRRR
jgi:hypothetical protein